MTKKLIFILTILIFVLGFSGSGNAQSEDLWLGGYEHGNVGNDISEAGWVTLTIKKFKGELIAISEYGQTGTVGKDLLKVKVIGDTAFFYYDHCLPVEGEEEPCQVYRIKKGDLMFKLVKGAEKNGRIPILTYGVKDDSLPKGKIFFKRILN